MIERLKALHLTLESVLQLVDEGGYHMISRHITRYQCLQLCICNHLCIILYMYIIHVCMYHFPYTCANIILYNILSILMWLLSRYLFRCLHVSLLVTFVYHIAEIEYVYRVLLIGQS